MRPFQARFTGRCITCGNAITKGELITWNRTKGSHGQAQHAACAASATQAECDSVTSKPAGEAKPAATDTATASLLETLAAGILPYIESQLSSAVDAEQVADIVSHMLTDMSKSITVTLPDKSTVDVGLVHSDFESILGIVSADVPLYMFSHMPGVGKSTIAAQVAQALGFPYYSDTLSPATPEWKIFGYGDANGNYIASNFYKAYTGGGVYFVDEFDNGSASLLATLNQSISNGHASFPVLGMVNRHANFRFLAAGNTPARGANPRFPDRRPQDGATLDRLAYWDLPIDEFLERSIYLTMHSDSKWLDWIQAVRQLANTKYIKLIVSPRAALNGARLLSTGRYAADSLADMLVFKGCDNATKQAILAEIHLPRL
jgi:hypothetical protein